MFKKQDANLLNTRTWIKLNEDSRSTNNRRIFLDTYGGSFEKSRKGYVWKEVVQNTEPVEKVKSGPIVIFPNGEEQEVTNMTRFCREHDLNKSALYAILRGDRKKHKGFSIRKG